ncbi:MAG: hypothetical protein ACRD3Y_11035, partial [Bryobacteraceae bacterium]
PTLLEAITFIAQIARRENESNDSSKRRVRDHIRKAAGRKKKPRFDAPRDSSARVGEPFWRWATGEWPILRKVQGFPHAPINPIQGSASLRFSCSGPLTALPNTPQAFEKAYFEARAEVHRLKSQQSALAYENANLKAKVQSVESDLEAIRQRDAVTCKRRSEAGKRGKGIKHRR